MSDKYRIMMGWMRDYSIWNGEKRVSPWVKTWDELRDIMFSMGLSFTPGDYFMKKQDTAGLGIPFYEMTNQEVDELTDELDRCNAVMDACRTFLLECKKNDAYHGRLSIDKMVAELDQLIKPTGKDKSL